MVIKIKFKGKEEIIYYSSFDELVKLDNYNDITYLDCSYNNLNSLPTLPSSLTELYCSGNNLTSLPTLSSSLTKLWCSVNKITSLPTLPSSLTRLYCGSNNLTSLPILPSSLTELYLRDNPIKKYIIGYFKGDWEKYRNFQHFTLKKYTDKIGNWFLECKYNPKYKYCQGRLTREYNELFREE